MVVAVVIRNACLLSVIVHVVRAQLVVELVEQGLLWSVYLDLGVMKDRLRYADRGGGDPACSFVVGGRA